MKIKKKVGCKVVKALPFLRTKIEKHFLKTQTTPRKNIYKVSYVEDKTAGRGPHQDFAFSC